ncbi:hypothetical protein BKA01_007909 [Pseudonocardia eucalypti]|uniref:SRPBCC family protein n=1 Tax=Pseudonocardia eucalypti TaxID=648755 RepID=UPI0016171AEC|nr:hypothetical protein [Pseudonocardia eucalypti]
MTVPRPLTVVTDHIADFAHVAAALPAVLVCARLDTGVPRVGSRWRVRIGGFRLPGELECTLTRRRPHWVTFTASRAGAAFTLDYACVDLDHSTEVHASLQYEEARGPAGCGRWLIARPLGAAVRAATSELVTWSIDQ